MKTNKVSQCHKTSHPYALVAAMTFIQRKNPGGTLVKYSPMVEHWWNFGETSGTLVEHRWNTGAT